MGLGGHFPVLPEPPASQEKLEPLTGSWREGLQIGVSDLSLDLVTMGHSPLSGTPAVLLQQDCVSSSWRDVARGPAVRCSPDSGKARRLPRPRLQLRIRGRKQQGSGGVTGTDRTLGCPSLACESRQGERCREQSNPPVLDPLMVAKALCPPE